MTTNINIKTDSVLKKNAEVLFEELGMNMSTALNIFLRQAVRENRIPFEITGNVPNTETIKAMEDVKANRNMSPAFDNMEDLVNSLNA
jgi:DNA-damage-inducible protein J